MNYTKGEWKRREIQEGDKSTFIGHTDEYQITSANGVECVAIMGTGWATGKAKANAQLIASAPDLYEALKDITTLINDIKPFGDEVAQQISANAKELAIEKIAQALAKAEGKNE